MPGSYIGVEGNVPADRSDVVGATLIGADARNSTSINAKLQAIYDRLQRVWKKAGFLDIASNWTTLQTFSSGIAGTTAVLSGNVTVGGTLGVTGAVTASASVATPTVTATTFAYTSAVARFAYVDASQFKSSGTINYTNGVSASEIYSSGTDAVTARIAAPAGATITGLDIIVINQNNVAYSFTATYLVRISVSGTTLTRTQLHAAGGGGQTITIPADITGALVQFLACPLIASPGAVPTNGYLLLNMTMPGNVAVRVQGVRLAYSLASVAPST